MLAVILWGTLIALAVYCVRECLASAELQPIPDLWPEQVERLRQEMVD